MRGRHGALCSARPRPATWQIGRSACRLQPRLAWPSHGSIGLHPTRRRTQRSRKCDARRWGQKCRCSPKAVQAFASSPYVGCGYTDAGLRTLRWLRGDRRTHALSRRANVPLKSCAGSPSDALPRHGVVVSCPSGQRPQGPLGGDLTRQPAVPRTAGIGALPPLPGQVAFDRICPSMAMAGAA
jgi:hypothetical protein